jgi:heme ABC exporter ATP-binding subunit CcmA
MDAQGLARIAGRRHLLRDVSLSAGSGEVLAVVGRNGAGKTTLLSVLAGRFAPDRGRVTLREGGREVGRHRAASLVGWLPHDLFLYPDLTARENLAFFAALYGVPDAAARIASALAEVGLPRDGDRPVRTLSRGMQQRAAIGRLIVTGARVWLLDEPTTGLDEPGRRWLAAVVNAQARVGCLVLMATHHRGEVAGAATRVVVLEAGRLVLDVGGGEAGAAAAFARLDGEAAR